MGKQKIALFRGLVLLCLSIGLWVYSSASEFSLNWDNTVSIWRVQVSSQTTEWEADSVRNVLLEKGITPIEIDPPSISKWYRILSGCWATKSEGTTYLQQIKDAGFSDALLVTTDITNEEAQSRKLSILPTLYQELMIKTLPQKGKTADTLFSDAKAWHKTVTDSTTLDCIGQALSGYAQVIVTYPDTLEGEESQFNLARLYSAIYYRGKKQFMLSRSEQHYYIQAALEAYREFILNYPKSEKLSLAEKEFGDCLHAASLYRQSRLSKSAEQYQKVILSQGTNVLSAEAYLQYSGVRFEMAINDKTQWPEVRDILLKGYATFCTATNKRIPARLYLMYGESYLFTKNYPAFYENLEFVVKTYPKEMPEVAMAKYYMGKGYYQQRKLDLAVSYFRQVMDDYYEHSDKDLVPMALKMSMREMAFILSMQNKRAEAISVLNKLLLVLPETDSFYPKVVVLRDIFVNLKEESSIK